MPIYDVSAVAHAIDLDLKQLDNLLSRNVLSGLEKKRRGIARRLTPELAVVIRVAKELADTLGVSPGSVLPVAYRIEQSTSDEIQLGEFMTLRIDRSAIRASTFARLDNAVEVVGRRKRGRPRRRPSASAGQEST